MSGIAVALLAISAWLDQGNRNDDSSSSIVVAPEEFTPSNVSQDDLSGSVKLNDAPAVFRPEDGAAVLGRADVPGGTTSDAKPGKRKGQRVTTATPTQDDGVRALAQPTSTSTPDIGVPGPEAIAPIATATRTRTPSSTPTSAGAATATATRTPTAAAIPNTPTATPTSPSGFPTSRNKLSWPFAQNSIWNMPIGSNATYVDANITSADWATGDEDVIVMSPNAPLRRFYANGVWGQGRCGQSGYQGFDVPIPDNYTVPDASGSWTPNFAGAFLMPDARTIVQANPVSRCAAGGPITSGWRAPDVDIYGTGIPGGHGGSGLSSIGGTIRLGELTGSAPIRHALKVNLWCARYCSLSNGPGGGNGYRWPALRADAYANPTSYGGSIAGLKMGSLLAIRPSVTEQSLALQTPAGRKLFHAFQDYGAYVVDDTYWDAHAIEVEYGVFDEFQDFYGYGFEGSGGAFYNDYMRIFAELHVVDNNGSSNIGGGGTPRAPLAPPLSN